MPLSLADSRPWRCLISVVGVAGVLAFSVSGRTREFGIRMALGAQPRNILTGVLLEGLVMAGIGVGAGVVVGFGFARALGRYVARGASARRALVCRVGDRDTVRGGNCVGRSCGARRTRQCGGGAARGVVQRMHDVIAA